MSHAASGYAGVTRRLRHRPIYYRLSPVGTTGAGRVAGSATGEAAYEVARVRLQVGRALAALGEPGLLCARACRGPPGVRGARRRAGRRPDRSDQPANTPARRPDCPRGRSPAPGRLRPQQRENRRRAGTVNRPGFSRGERSGPSGRSTHGPRSGASLDGGAMRFGPDVTPRRFQLDTTGLSEGSVGVAL